MLRRRGLSGALASLWRIRLLTSFCISLPVLFLVVWYGGRALISLSAYREASGEALPLTAEVFHIHLHDRIRHDLRRMSRPSPPENPSLPVFSLELTRSNLQALTDVPRNGARRPFVPVFISRDGNFKPAKVRVRGGRHWHWAHPQKSLKIIMDPKENVSGFQIFNLINEVAPITVGERVILDILRDQGVLTPMNRLVRVTINRRPMGVYMFLSQVDEGLLRKNRRMYGSLYSGNRAPIDPEGGLSTLWRDPAAWGKIVSWIPEENRDRREMETLLAMINTAPDGDFAAFARDELDLRAFASFDAVDAVFGGNQHDWDENHKLYFDPYRGRFEPVAWNFRGWRHEPAFLAVENPLRLRLARVPGYLTLRNRIVFTLLRGPCSVAGIRAALLREVRRASPEFACDPYWDAYKLLPPVNRALRRMVRPMDEERQALVLESEIKTFSRRHAFLMDLLERDDLSVRLGERRGDAVPLDVAVNGYGAYRLSRVRAVFPAGRGSSPWRVYRDSDLDDRFDPDRDEAVTPAVEGPAATLPVPALLEPAAQTVPRESPSPAKGRLALEPAPRRYRFFLASGDGPAEVELGFLNVVTGWRVARVVKAGGGIPEEGAAPEGSVDDVPGFEPGATSVHPWAFRKALHGPVLLGPGIVTFDKTRVFGEDEPVTVAPGTTLSLGPGVSLIFRARLEARGTEVEPILVERADPNVPFGGLALQGRGCAESVLEHVRIAGGTKPAWKRVRFPGMVNLHDAREVLLRSVRFENNRDSDDALHIAYGRDIVLDGCTFSNVWADALDLEFSEASVRDCRFLRTPDECLDLMGSRVDIEDCVLLGARTNAISVGERSRVRVFGSLVAASRTGILVKSRSEAALGGNLFYGNGTAVHLVTRSPKYGGRSRVLGDLLHAVQCGVPVHVDDGSAPGVSRVVTRFPHDGSLDHLLRDVLGLEHWHILAERLETEGGAAWGGGK